MTPRPYAPPHAQLRETDATLLARRPLSVWIPIVAGLPFFAAFLFGCARFVWHISTQPGIVPSATALVFALSWRGAILFAAVVTVIGILNRRWWGRWLGVLALACLFAFFARSTTSRTLLHDAEHFAESAFSLTVMALFCWWGVYAFAFSRTARLYFSRTTPPQPPSQPDVSPPPAEAER